MALLTGTYEHNLDAKGRLALPAVFRKLLPETVYITTSPEGALNVYSEEGFMEWIDSLTPEGFDARNRNHVKLRRDASKNAFPVDLDASGRISIPAKLRERAGLTKEVVVVGEIDYVAIWDAEAWEKAEAEEEPFDGYYTN